MLRIPDLTILCENWDHPLFICTHREPAIYEMFIIQALKGINNWPIQLFICWKMKAQTSKRSISYRKRDKLSPFSGLFCRLRIFWPFSGLRFCLQCDGSGHQFLLDFFPPSYVHMKTKCPKQPGHLPKEENHWYAPCPEIKPHLKNVWQSPKNPLAHLKCVSHMWPKCVCFRSWSLGGSQLNGRWPWPLGLINSNCLT